MNINQRIIENFASSIFVFNHVLQGKMNRLCSCKPITMGETKALSTQNGSKFSAQSQLSLQIWNLLTNNMWSELYCT